MSDSPQAKTRRGLAVNMKSGAIAEIQMAQQEASASIARIRSDCASLLSIASKDKKPLLQIVYMQANALHQGENNAASSFVLSHRLHVRIVGEQYDVTSFAGVCQYECLRVHGECGPGHVSSCHLRATDFESMCQPEKGDPEPKVTFAKNTRKLFLPCLVYTAAIHLAWQKEGNHESISPKSRCFLQSTRDDLSCLANMDLDPAAQIVTLIIDVFTDKGHLHFVKAVSGSAEENPEDEDKGEDVSAL